MAAAADARQPSRNVEQQQLRAILADLGLAKAP
jgi:hypothetical protein